LASLSALPALPTNRSCFNEKQRRGVTVAGGKVYLGTLDGRVIALDQKTGKELWATQLLDTRKKKGANFTSAGTVLVAGPTGGDIGQRGQIYGIDAETGKRLWEFDTIRNDQASWPGNSGDTGGGSAWLPGHRGLISSAKRQREGANERSRLSYPA
jgi:alcohol dehydrogenase (cytochrome c)